MDIRYIEAFTLDEMAAENGKQLTHERVARCEPLRVKFVPKTKRYVFLVRCTERWSDPKGHIVSLRFDTKKNLPKVNEVDVRVFCSCLTGDTVIPLLDGRNLSLAELDGEFGQERDFWVYSVDSKGDFVPGKARSLGITKFVDTLVDVELDNGEVISCTEDHRFMLRDGSYTEARTLVPGQSLMPLYFSEGCLTGDSGKKSPYLKVKDNSGSGWKYVHRVVANSICSSGKQALCFDNKHNYPVIHHLDKSRYNNDPSNLIWLLRYDHWYLHAQDYNRDNVVNAYKEIWKDPSRVEELVANNSRAGRRCIDLHPELVESFSKAGAEWCRNNRDILSDRMKKMWKEKRAVLLASQESVNLDPKFREIRSKSKKAYWLRPESEAHRSCLRERLRKLDKRGSKNVMKRPGYGLYVTLCRAVSAAFSIEKEHGNLSESLWVSEKSKYSIGDVHLKVGWDKFLGLISLAKIKSLDGGYSGFHTKDKKDLLSYCIEKETENHKVVKVTVRNLDIAVPVYDLNVEGTENFLLSSGVVVHNCPAFLYYGSSYISTTLDYNLSEGTENRFPFIRDPGLINTTCKHVLTVRKKVLDTITMKSLRGKYSLQNVKTAEGIRTAAGNRMSFEEYAVRETLKSLHSVPVDSCQGAVENFLKRSGGFSDNEVESFLLDLTPGNFEDRLNSVGMLVRS